MANCSYSANGQIPRDAQFTSAVRSKRFVGCQAKFSDLETDSVTTDDLFAINNTLSPPVIYDVFDALELDDNFVANGGINNGSPTTEEIASNTTVIENMLARGENTTIFFPAGYYVFNPFTVGNRIRLEGGKDVVLQVIGGGITVNGSGSTLSDFLLYGDNTPGSVGITLTASANPTLINRVRSNPSIGFTKFLVSQITSTGNPGPFVRITESNMRGIDIGLELEAPSGRAFVDSSYFSGGVKAINCLANSCMFVSSYFFPSPIGIDFNSTTGHEVIGTLFFSVPTPFQNVGADTVIVSNEIQQAKINDPAGGATVDAEARTAINAIIDVLETFGFSAAV
jgi:hypothetical protein